MNRLLLLSALCASLASALTFTDGSSQYPGALLLGATIEGASVDAAGALYAVNQTAILNLSTGAVLHSAPPTDTPTTNFASSRHLPNGNLLLGDAALHTVSTVTADGLTPVFADTPFDQPNDLAVSTDGSRVYTSSMNYTAGTGQLVFIPGAGPGVPVSLPENIARLNGIEVAADNSRLFVTSAGKPDAGVIPSAEIWVFDLDASGAPANGRVFFDIYKTLADLPEVQSGLLDPDGMRADTAGYLYATLNAAGKILKINTNDPEDYEVVELATVAFPTNLEMGGKDGKTLVVVGRCAGEGAGSCVDVAEVEAEGRAWKMLQGGAAPTPGKGCKLRQPAKVRRAAYKKD